jgi:hypothetical protein
VLVVRVRVIVRSNELQSGARHPAQQGGAVCLLTRRGINCQQPCQDSQAAAGSCYATLLRLSQ